MVSGNGCVFTGDLENYNQITTLNFALASPKFTANFTAKLLGKFKFLSRFLASTNQITIADFSTNYLIRTIELDNNQLNSINVANLRLLTSLLVSDNLLSSATITGCTALINLNLRNNALVTLNCANLSRLRGIDLFNNDLTSLTVTGCTDLLIITANSNALVTLNTDDCVDLQELILFNNQLTSLSIANNAQLINVRVHQNKLTNTTISQLLVDLDSHGLSGGYFRALIFGGGTLTTAGSAAKLSLAAKGWTIVGV